MTPGEVDVRLLGRLVMGAPPEPGLDWQAAMDLARRHGVSPLLHWRVRELADEAARAAVPQAVRDGLRQDFMLAGGRAMIVERQLGQVLGALAGAGVPAVVVKGAALAALFPDPALRVYGDLDILVPQAQLDQAEAVLDGLGYRAMFDREWSLAHHHHLPPMEDAEGRLAVELHWRLDDPGRAGRLPAGELWSRVAAWSVGGQQALRLEQVDAALHVCRHVVVQNRARGGLRALADLAQAMGGWGPGEWEALVRRAGEYGLRSVVYLMLVLVEQALGRAAPPQVLAALCPPGAEPLPDDVLERVLAVEADDQARVLIALARAGGRRTWRARLRRVLEYLFPPRSRLAIEYGLPAGSPRLWLARLAWPWDVASRYGRTVWAAWRGERAASAAWEHEAWLERWLGQEPDRGSGTGR